MSSMSWLENLVPEGGGCLPLLFTQEIAANRVHPQALLMQNSHFYPRLSRCLRDESWKVPVFIYLQDMSMLKRTHTQRDRGRHGFPCAESPNSRRRRFPAISFT